MRQNGRGPRELRKVSIHRGYTRHAEGSVLIECGDTKVICTASIEERVPAFLKGKGQGWLTAEYGMLPRSTNTRMDREAARGKQSGRTQEIQRLIGRSLRAVTMLSAWGERTVHIDCDVVQADGGVPEQHFARFGRGDLDLLPPHDLGPTGLVNANRFRHGRR